MFVNYAHDTAEILEKSNIFEKNKFVLYFSSKSQFKMKNKTVNLSILGISSNDSVNSLAFYLSIRVVPSLVQILDAKYLRNF